MILLFLTFFFVFSKINNITTIHLIPHSHCDAGWIKTTDQYYEDQVKFILDRTIDYTYKNKKKYNWVETIFLHMWWTKDATDTQKNQLLELIKNGTWDMIMGGWVMTDQALPTYSAVIDQMTLGHVFLMNELNVKPKRGFAIDPFGLSSVIAQLYREMGFETHVIMRIPSYMKSEMKKTQNLEFHWSDSSDPTQSLFTHILWNLYMPPMPFQYWDPGFLNPPVTPKNIEELSRSLLDFSDNRIPAFRNKQHLLFPFGSDFAYTCPDIIYGNMSLLIDYINEHYSTQYHIQYSTLSHYFDEILTSGTEYPVLEDKSFFVYSDDDESQWSGYYTSQPRLKIQARRGEYLSRMMEQVFSISYISSSVDYFQKQEWQEFYNSLFALRSKNGQLQHHDALPGTCKFFVTDYYCNQLDEAISGAYNSTTALLSTLISPTLFFKNQNKSIFVQDPSPSSRVIIHDGDEFGVMIYNSLSASQDGNSVWIEFTFESDEEIEVGVSDVEGNIYPSEVIVGKKSENKEIIVQMNHLPALGYQYIIISVKKKKEEERSEEESETLFLSNDIYEIFFNPTTKKIAKINNKISGISMYVSFDFLYYPSFYSLDPLHQSSGAYIFRPKKEGQKLEPVSKHPPEVDLIIDNSLVTEIHQTFCEYIKIITRLYKSDSLSEQQAFLEIEFIQLGQIPIGYEVVMRVETEINNNQVIFHDELAYEMKKREYHTSTKEPVASNFYPMQYSSFIQDDNTQLTVMSTKSQGVSSQRNGEMQIMIHRTTVFDDLRGVFQPLLDPYVVTKNDGFKLRFSLDTKEGSIKTKKKSTYDLNFPPQVFFMDPSHWNIKSYPKDFSDTFSFLKDKVVPENLHLVTLASNDFEKNPSEFVCRWLNVYEKWESSESVKIDLNDVFNSSPSKITKSSLSLLHDLSTSSDIVSFDPLQFGTFKMEFRN